MSWRWSALGHPARALLGVAAAQPVVVHHHLLGQRDDVQVFFVFDTSTSMSARTGPHGETRLARAKKEAEEMLPKLGSIPVGLASMTDRVLPSLMPTTNARTSSGETPQQSIGINQPPPESMPPAGARRPSRPSIRS